MGKMAEKRIQGEESKYGEALSKNKHLSSQHSLGKLNNKVSPPNISDDEGRGTDQKCSDVNIWFVPNNGTCECGSDLNEIVLCDPVTKDLAIMDCYCITYQYSSEGEPMFPVVGGCVFNCVNHTRSGYANIYHSAPSDCASLNRQGTLCGQCLDGYTVPAYSYEFKCIRCDRELENWGLYIVFAFLPLTLFIVIILVFRINVLSPKLYMYVYAAQCLSIPAQVKVILYYLSQKKSPALHTVPAAMVLSNYGIWNLDFVRVNVLPDVCIDVIPLHILVLDYLIAIYPMLLMAALYAMVELYGFEFRPLRCMWKPFHYFFARFRRHWGIQTTIMDAFVTFFFLSTTKLLSVSCDLLISTKVYTREGKPYSRNLFYDPSITYFGKEHLPYALMALAILTVFIAFPTSLLLCYQCKVYRKCLTKCQIHGNIVETFVESFQKYYKDGSNGTWDCRWFAGFWVLFKCFCYLIYSISLNDICFALLTVTSLIGATIVVIVQPYREEYSAFNVISANLFLWQALVCAFMSRESLSAIVAAEFKDHFFCVFLLWLVPLTYIIGIPLHKLVVKFRQWQLQKASSLTSSLPHRLVHSDQYRHPPS
ncbi:hypothetical protein GBAR_LOCUS14094 [Geodia barretti]|uniref:Uncharacterized protein n=2 Tax=Geodia barretti TaxID=519541 RepID=A0AA35WJY1_GEOBA|nr:hypothetical protein GBAR_LOCUS14094 [Geodia barretti]